MYLIAVDEAGYGPKLGPLVVAATLWENSTESSQWDDQLAATWEIMKSPVPIAGQKIRVDDSKRIFQSRTQRRGDTSPLGNLHRVLSFAHHAMGRTESTWQERLPTLIPDDLNEAAAVPWLAEMLTPGKWLKELPDAWLDEATVAPAIDAWSLPDWKLTDARARLITAKAFNAFCEPSPTTGNSANKSDLLGETSLNLVASLTESNELRGHTHGQIFFDRHGGRRYYAGVIAATFPEATVRVVDETSRCSIYDVQTRHHQLRMHFTVKGDSFVPVAMSSLHAKCLREIAMTFLNQFFADRWIGPEPFQPTAGYPVDADRFLEAAATTLTKHSISPSDLVRCR
jgi:ribonuclease HII